MALVSTFCKKGGVGKTTFIGYFAHYYATKGNKVLVLSVDDQNSIFKIFGIEDKIFSENDNYLEFLMAGHAEMGDILIEARENLYLIKTLNTDKLSMKLTLERRQEKILKAVIDEYQTFFDYVFIDFPPSSSRLTEVLLDMSDDIILVIGLDSLGLGGYFNTIQYFIDNEINLEGIKYIVPNGYAKNKRAPKVSLESLTQQSSEFTASAKVLEPINDRSIIKNIQYEGYSVFDENLQLTPYDTKALATLKTELTALFDKIEV